MSEIKSLMKEIAEAIREYLAAEQLEPVGKVLSEAEMGVAWDRKAGDVIWWNKPKGPALIYTAPPAPAAVPPYVPLTDEEIALAIFDASVDHSPFKRDGSTSVRMIARAIERAVIAKMEKAK